MTPEEFEELFKSRTLAYHPEFRNDERPVVICFGDSADSAPGHLLMVALANLLARAHRRLVFVGDLDRPLRCFDHFGLGSLAGATVGLAQEINPLIDATVASRTPDEDTLITIGAGAPGDLTIGCQGWIAHLNNDTEVGADRTSLLGAGLAACLAAAAAFHRAIGHLEIPSGAYSLWDYARRSGEQGPYLLGTLDVGRVLQVGAGAVGGALDFWASFISVESQWLVVDGDEVEASNLNRQLPFLARDAGFPAGQPAQKARVVADRSSGSFAAITSWYDSDDWADQRTSAFDLVLPLANERAIRPLVHARPQSVYLHATTTASWTAIVHRHVATHDDCIVCRLPEEADPWFTCSTGQVGETVRADASLPFLSGLAGLLLLAELIRLQLGQLITRPTNFGAVDLHAPEPVVSAYLWTCSDGCRVWLPVDARRMLGGGRFSGLEDQEVAQRGPA